MQWNLPGSLALAFILAGPMGWGAPAQPSQPLPTPFPEARYQRMSAKSPFAVASGAAAPVAPAGPGFASQLYISAVAQIGEKDFVTVKSRDPDKPFSAFLEVGGTTADGMKVQSMQWSDERAKTTVTVVSNQGEKATLAFDQEQMDKNAAASVQPAPGPYPGQPGVRLPIPPGQGPPPGFPMANGQFQRNRAFFQQQAQPGPGQMPGSLNGVQLRRRVRIIQSGQ
jgi:hypothetical protein